MSRKTKLRNRRTAALAVLAALVAAATLALVPSGALGGAGSAGGHTVTLKEISFHPGTLNIRRGESVRWLWRDEGTQHNVTFSGFHSRTQGQGSYSVRFTRRGTYNYRCTIHVALGMKGRVIVH